MRPFDFVWVAGAHSPTPQQAAALPAGVVGLGKKLEGQPWVGWWLVPPRVWGWGLFFYVVGGDFAGD